MRKRVSFFFCATLLLPVMAIGANDKLMVCDDVADPMTLDPGKEFSEKNHTICQQIFDGLLRFNPEGQMEPALAVSWNRIDPTRMRFKLRQGVTFHNGEPFDAEAVKFTIERLLAPKTGFPGRAFIASISHAEIVDDNAVDIVTRFPDALLLNRLAALVLILPPRYIKEKGDSFFAENPIGTGAFMFKKWEKGREIALPANPNYWMKGYPRVNELIFKFIPQKDQLDALFSGKIHLLTDLPGDQILTVVKRPGFTVMKKPAFCAGTFVLKMSSGPLNNLDVRKALNYALDKRALISYDLLGNGRPIATFSMPGEAGHNPSLRPYEFDLKKARQLLGKAGYPGGFTLKMLAKPSMERTTKIIAAQFKKLGVNLDITVAPDAAIIGEFASGKYDMGVGDCVDPMVHSYFVQSIALHSKSPYSLSGFPGFDAKLEDVASTVDDKLFLEKAQAIDKYIYDNALSIFTYQKFAVCGLRENLRFEPAVTRMPYFYAAHFIGP